MPYIGKQGLYTESLKAIGDALKNQDGKRALIACGVLEGYLANWLWKAQYFDFKNRSGNLEHGTLFQIKQLAERAADEQFEIPEEKQNEAGRKAFMESSVDPITHESYKYEDWLKASLYHQAKIRFMYLNLVMDLNELLGSGLDAVTYEGFSQEQFDAVAASGAIEGEQVEE